MKEEKPRRAQTRRASPTGKADSAGPGRPPAKNQNVPRTPRVKSVPYTSSPVVRA